MSAEVKDEIKEHNEIIKVPLSSSSSSSTTTATKQAALPRFPKIIILYFIFIIFEVFSGKY
jgi:hypothetical protein